jgi:hypothetical protein
MGGSDRRRPTFKERCELSLALRRSGAPIEGIVAIVGWPDKQAALVAISRAKRPERYFYKPGLKPKRGCLAFGGTLVDGKAFQWSDYDAQLKAWVAADMKRPEMAKKLSEMTGRLFTTNQIIGRIYRLRQAELAKKKRGNICD